MSENVGFVSAINATFFVLFGLSCVDDELLLLLSMNADDDAGRRKVRVSACWTSRIDVEIAGIQTFNSPYLTISSKLVKLLTDLSFDADGVLIADFIFVMMMFSLLLLLISI